MELTLIVLLAVFVGTALVGVVGYAIDRSAAARNEGQGPATR